MRWSSSGRMQADWWGGWMRGWGGGGIVYPARLSLACNLLKIVTDYLDDE